MVDIAATHYVKSHVAGTASGLYYRSGEVLYPILAISDGRLINIPAGWTNNRAIEVFKLVEDNSEVVNIDWKSEPRATHYSPSRNGGFCWYEVGDGKTYRYKRECDSYWSVSSALLCGDGLIERQVVCE